jgi:hypothetical protein
MACDNSQCGHTRPCGEGKSCEAMTCFAGQKSISIIVTAS